MSYLLAMEQINKGHVKPVYLLYGEESYHARQIEQAVVNKLLSPDEQDMNLTILNKDPSQQELINLIETVPFIGSKNVIVLRNTQLFRSNRKQEDETNSEKQENHLTEIIRNMPHYSHIIFSTGDKIDKRLKLYKVIEKQGAVIELNPLKLKEAITWIEARIAEMGKRLDNRAHEYILALLSLMPKISITFLNNELTKLDLYTARKPVISQADIMQIFSPVPEVSVFTMVEAVSQKQTKRALTLLEEQFHLGEHPLKVIALLVRQIRLLWQTKDMIEQGLASRDIAAKLGLPYFVAEKLVNQSRYFTGKQLKQAIIVLAAADRALKSGQGNESTVEQIIIELCK